MISILLLIIFGISIYSNMSLKTKEIFNYLIVGVLTTIVSILSYNLFRLFIDNYTLCTILSLVISVLFAYITNRKFVFNSDEKNILKEFASFVSSRILSLFFEIVFMYLFVELIKIDDRLSKIVVQFFIVILNYIFSKLFVFKKNNFT